MTSEMPRAQRIGIWTAWTLFGFGLFEILFNPWSPVLALPWAFAALGLSHNQTWAGYGPALWIASLLAWTGSELVFGELKQPLGWESAGGLAMLAGIALLMYRAGRATSQAGGRSLSAERWGWVLLPGATIAFLSAWMPMAIPTGAMEKTLLNGDRLLVKRAPGLTPLRRDIVMFRYPVNPNQFFVKRIVGLPGDRIRIVGKKLIVNGEPQAEPYIWNATQYMDSFRDNFPSAPTMRLYPQADAMLRDNIVAGEVVVPPGKYFGLGDNRDSSLDSRYWGFIGQSDIIGKPWIVYFSADLPLNRDRDEWPPIAITHTRWDRLFKRIE
jgi:signal peptidase I